MAAVFFHVVLPGPAKHRLRQHRNHAAERTRMRPVSRNLCDLSQQPLPYRRQGPASATGVLQEASRLFSNSVFCRKHLCGIFVFYKKHLTLAHKNRFRHLQENSALGFRLSVLSDTAQKCQAPPSQGVSLSIISEDMCQLFQQCPAVAVLCSQ